MSHASLRMHSGLCMHVQKKQPRRCLCTIPVQVVPMHSPQKHVSAFRSIFLANEETTEFLVTFSASLRSNKCVKYFLPHKTLAELIFLSLHCLQNKFTRQQASFSPPFVGALLDFSVLLVARLSCACTSLFYHQLEGAADKSAERMWPMST